MHESSLFISKPSRIYHWLGLPFRFSRHFLLSFLSSHSLTVSSVTEVNESYLLSGCYLHVPAVTSSSPEISHGLNLRSFGKEGGEKTHARSSAPASFSSLVSSITGKNVRSVAVNLSFSFRTPSICELS